MRRRSAVTAAAPTLTSFTMRCTREWLQMIDDWCAEQGNQISRPSRTAAVKHLVTNAIRQSEARKNEPQ